MEPMIPWWFTAVFCFVLGYLIGNPKTRRRLYASINNLLGMNKKKRRSKDYDYEDDDEDDDRIDIDEDELVRKLMRQHHFDRPTANRVARKYREQQRGKSDDKEIHIHLER